MICGQVNYFCQFWNWFIFLWSPIHSNAIPNKLGIKQVIPIPIALIAYQFNTIQLTLNWPTLLSYWKLAILTHSSLELIRDVWYFVLQLHVWQSMHLICCSLDNLYLFSVTYSKHELHHQPCLSLRLSAPSMSFYTGG